MKIFPHFLALFLLFSLKAKANCFLISENGKIIEKVGESCDTRQTPCSSFKVAIALMGYDDGFLIDEKNPLLPFKKSYQIDYEKWKMPHDPSLWIKNSCVWYSQQVTQHLGAKKFQKYVDKFNYGNRDISGDKEKNNGLMESWISSSLAISPNEQLYFFEKFAQNKLPVSLKAHEITKNILFFEKLPNGWKIYGKTGSCDLIKNNVVRGQVGWFNGFAQKGNKKLVFVNYIEEEGKQDYMSGKHARKMVRENFLKKS